LASCIAKTTFTQRLRPSRQMELLSYMMRYIFGKESYIF